MSESVEILPALITPSDPNPPKLEGFSGPQPGGDELNISLLVNGLDFWLCSRDDGVNVGYAFQGDLSGTYVFSDSNDETASLFFNYFFIDDSSVNLTYTYDDGSTLEENIGGIIFSSLNSFTGTSNTDGPLFCQRTDISEDAPTVQTWRSTALSQHLYQLSNN